MGTGVCSRRQKSLLHTALCLLAVLGLGGGLYLYNYVQDKTRSSEIQAMKFKQQHEALSAQLQVVYEHRSRLERSLQKEKGEHKKTKEDYLVYKLEAQEALNKEKQDSMNRYGALSSQQKILKNQNEEIKKQLSDLQVEHGSLKLEHRKTIELHNQQVSQLKRDKDNEILNLQDTISKLREESKLLRKAHQDVHSQLLSAQAQMEEFRQLKDALKRMPSFKDPGTSTQNQHSFPYSKNLNKPFAQLPQGSLRNDRREENVPGGAAQHVKEASQAQPTSQSNSQILSPTAHLTALGPGTRNDSHVGKFTRTVNSLQGYKEDENPAVSPHVQQPPQHPAVHKGVLPDLPGALDKKTPTVNVLLAKEQVPVHSWQDIVSKVNARMTKEESDKVDGSDGLVKTQTLHANVAVGKWENRAMHRGYLRRIGDNEAEMDAGVIDREDGPPPMKQHVGQEALAQEDAADPAKDPNNQGEDEYEEAEIDRPAFEEKANAEKQPPAQPEVDRPMEPDTELKSREEAEDRYQDDQEQEIDERGGEPENGDDLELVQDEEVVKVDTRNRKEGYY